MAPSFLGSLQDLDTILFLKINRAGAPWLDSGMTLVSSNIFWWSIAGLITLALIPLKRKDLWITWGLVLVTVGLSDLFTTYALKEVIQRDRPCYQLPGVRLPGGPCGGKFGFPSNHAANGMAAVTLAYLRLRKPWAAWLFSLALLVGLSRIYLGVHFPSDVLVGYLEGGLLGYLVYLVSKRGLASS